MTWETIKSEAYDKGVEQKSIEDAKNCLAEGDSPEKVARCIGLPLERCLNSKNRFQ